MWPEVPEDLASLSDVELAELESQFVAAFAEATAEGAAVTDDTIAELSGVADTIERLRTEQGTRSEAAVARQEQLSALANRVNASVEGDQGTEGETPEGGSEAEPAAAPETPAPEAAPAETPAEPATEAPVVAAAAPRPAASVAQFQRNTPARTRPREVADPGFSIVASADIPGVPAGRSVASMSEVADLMVKRRRTLGVGNSDNVTVVQFQRDIPKERQLSSDMSAEQVMSRLESFDTSPQGITASGGLCAPVNSFYGQEVVADASRPVANALAVFGADRGGIRFIAPPKLSDITMDDAHGIGVVTAAQDASNTTKTVFTVSCPSATEVDVAAIYTQLKFGNFGNRTFPERVAAWNQTALALTARRAEQFLLDGIAANSTSVTAAGLYGAGRELFARFGQAAAGQRSRLRMRPDAPLRGLLPAWALDLVQADFSRTFTDEPGLISMDQAEVQRLFGIRNLSISFYMDSKTGGGQIFGAANQGRSVADGATNSNTTVTSASGAFTAADINKPITGTGIPAGTTITAVASGTSVTISQAATATATGVTIRIGGNVLAEFPTTVFGYLFPEGSFLHLDAGTLDLGLVRDSTLVSSNDFITFTETFENVAFVGQESLEIAFNLSPDGSYAAARSATLPINS